MRIPPLQRGRLVARLANAPDEVEAAQRLRHLAFVAARGRGPASGQDSDEFDAVSAHLLVLDGDDPVACCRLRLHRGAEVVNSYAGRFYDLERLAGFGSPLLELGRFCLHPGRHDPDILRLAWAAMAGLVDAQGVGLMFGCSSFPGADAAPHAEALSLLCAHIGPDGWRPGRRMDDALPLAGLARPFNRARALAGTPPLLRSYLGMGGWVSDHAVPDPAMDTLHVFTAVEVAQIPPARARALRAIAAESVG